MHTGNHNEKPLDELVARGGRAVRRLSGLAASGLELGLLGKARRRSGSEVQNLDSRRRTERSCGMKRVAVAPIAVLVLFGGLLFGAGPAQAVTGGCSVASAPLIQSGQTQTSDAHLCADSREYWAIDLKIGDRLNVDVNPAPPSVFPEPYQFDVYGPNIGTIGSYLCRNEGSGASRVSCVIPAAGRYTLVTYGAGSFTPGVKSVPPKNGRVAGACDPENAPPAADRVAEYANGRVCEPSGSSEYWQMRLHRGDTLNVSSLAIRSSGNAEPFDLRVYGPGAGSLGNPICENAGLGPAWNLTCRIHASGRYVLEAANSGSFTPLVIRPTRTDVIVPALVKGGGAFPVAALVKSDAPHPHGTCLIQELSGRRWITVARVRTKTGACKRRIRPIHTGTLRIRVRFKGARGWASSTSRAVTVFVR